MKKTRLEQAFEAALEHHQAGRIAEAEVLYRQVLASQPNHIDALHLLGVLAAQIERFDDAVALINKACVLSPNVADYRMNLGNALGGKKDFQASIDAYRHALRLNPNCFISYDGIGAALRELGQVEQAADSHQRSLKINPNNPTAYYNLGMTLGTLGKLEEAKASYGRAIALDPNFADAHWNLSLLLLMTGDFEQGFREYEWRWRRKSFPSLWPNFPQPGWNGKDLAGKTVLVYTEQGYGDAIQFIRYAPMLASRGAKVIFLCQRPLARLMEGADGVDQVVSSIASPNDLPAFDMQCPMLSLPMHFETRVTSIPASVPYLKIDPALVQRWATKVDSAVSDRGSTGPKIGLVWAGSPTNKNEKYRSITLGHFAPLAKSNLTFVSLQKGPAASQSAVAPDGMTLIDLTDSLQDFADTAALISNLDLVITVDTAVAHLAGALGKPTWVLLASEQDWRWLKSREDSPWYPTMRLFRQSTPGDWSTVIERVSYALSNLPNAARRAA